MLGDFANCLHINTKAMWNQKLKQLDHNTLPTSFISLWGGDPGSLVLISDGINVVYRFTFHGAGRYLRITHKSLRSPLSLDAAISYHQHLFDQGLPVAEPVVSLDGRYVEELTQGPDVFLAQVVKEVPGNPVSVETASSALLETWGELLAKMHQTSTFFIPPHNFKFTSWTGLLEEFSPYAQKERTQIQTEFEKVRVQLETLTHTPFNFGLTHGDHRSRNVIISKETVSFIDFDDPVYNWFAADVARPFLDMYVTRDPKLLPSLESFVKGYSKITSSIDLSIEVIHLFLRFKALDIYLWTTNNWQGDEAPGGGSVKTWMKDMKAAIENAEKLMI